MPEFITTAQTGNLFSGTEAPTEGERFETLLAHDNLVVERIVSSTSAAQKEYVQPQDEWVVLLRGEASLEIAGNSVSLRTGDYLFLPAHTPHRVSSVTDGALWLAVHLHPAPVAMAKMTPDNSPMQPASNTQLPR